MCSKISRIEGVAYWVDRATDPTRPGGSGTLPGYPQTGQRIMVDASAVYDSAFIFNRIRAWARAEH